MRALPFLVIGLVACQAGVPTFDVTVDHPVEVTLRRGEDAYFGAQPLHLLFREVPQDSRCPTDVQCVWAGNGMVRLEVALGESPDTPRDLNTTLDPTSTVVGGYRITLLRLLPDPVSTSQIPQDAYRAQLRVERSGIAQPLD